MVSILAKCVTTHASTICRTLKSMGCTRQVIQRLLCSTVTSREPSLWQEHHMHYPSMFLWIDESGCDLRNCKRKCGYSLQGMKPRDHPLLIQGNCYSAIPVMSLDGIHNVYLVNVFGEKLRLSYRTAFYLCCNHTPLSSWIMLPYITVGGFLNARV